jgi:hypothetical protein
MILVTRPFSSSAWAGFGRAESARHHRTLGIDLENGILWFWIGDHTEYDRLIG